MTTRLDATRRDGHGGCVWVRGPDAPARTPLWPGVSAPHRAVSLPRGTRRRGVGAHATAREGSSGVDCGIGARPRPTGACVRGAAAAVSEQRECETPRRKRSICGCVVGALGCSEKSSVASRARVTFFQARCGGSARVGGGETSDMCRAARSRSLSHFSRGPRRVVLDVVATGGGVAFAQASEDGGVCSRTGALGCNAFLAVCYHVAMLASGTDLGTIDWS